MPGTRDEQGDMMLDSLDWLFDTVALIFLLLIVGLLIVLVVWLGALPGNIARQRQHPQADAINVLGWMGVLFVPLWPIAFAWGFVRRPTAGTAPEKEKTA